MIHINNIYIKMKNIVIVTVMAVLSTIVLTGCNDYLDVTPTSTLTDASFFHNLTEMNQGLTGVYNRLLPISLHRLYLSEMRSDNFWIPNSDESTSSQNDIVRFDATNLPDNSLVLAAWQDYFSLVSSANYFIYKLENADFEISDKLYKEYMGEARFLRALAYFDLVRLWGNVPVSTTWISADDALALKQSTPAEVYNNLIVPDLQYAVDNLQPIAIQTDGDTESTSASRASKYAAEALLGEVYMTMAGFPVKDTSAKDKAITCLQDVITNFSATGKTVASTEKEWNKMWCSDNDNKYFLFEIQYANDANESLGNPLTPQSITRKVAINYMTGYQYQSIIATTSSNLYVSPYDLGQHFFSGKAGADSTDHRAWATISYKSNATTSLYFTKFLEHSEKTDSMGCTNVVPLLTSSSKWPQDFPLIRLENVKLLLAEALGMENGLSYLNEIHTRAGMKAYTTADFDDENAYQEAVLDERRWEFAEEGVRWFDLVRTNKYVEKMKLHLTENADLNSSWEYMGWYSSNINENSYLYPIPTQQIEVREGLYVQNPGY